MNSSLKRKSAGTRSVTKPKSRSSRAKLAAAQHHVWSKVELEALNPLLQRQMLTGTNVMLARILLKKGCLVPLHSHHNEQVSYVIEGALKFVVDGKNITVRAGEVLTIPPHVPHLAKALRDTVSLDIFNPPRMDWINKTDAYLRK